MAKRTHKVTAEWDIPLAQAEHIETIRVVTKHVNSGAWPQEQADFSIDFSAERLAERIANVRGTHSEHGNIKLAHQTASKPLRWGFIPNTQAVEAI